MVPQGPCEFKAFGSTEFLEGIQYLTPTSKHTNFTKFRQGSDDKEGLFVYPEKGVAMCLIEKNGCSTWSTVFNKLTRGILTIKSAWYGVVPFHWSEARAEQVFRDPESSRIVWVREPLERFLSGFLDKCSVPYVHDPWNYAHICSFHWTKDQPPGFPLSQVKKWFESGHTADELNSHFSPQARHCELSKRLNEYSMIGLMSKANFSKDAGCMLERAGLGYLNEKGGVNGFPFLLQHKDSEEREKKQTEILKRFFTKELAYLLMDVFKEDYDLFRIRRPTWVDEATGEWYDRKPEITDLRQRVGGDVADEEVGAPDGEVDDLVQLAARAGYRLPPAGSAQI